MNDFFNRFLKNKCSKDDLESVIELFHSPEKAQFLDEKMHSHWDSIPNEEAYCDLDNTLYRIHYKISQSENENQRRFSLLGYLSRIAAVLFIPMLLISGYLLINKASKLAVQQTISTPLASRTTFELPDGSKIWLNSGPTISFPVKFDGKSREVKLTGQAYFDIVKNKNPFVVEANGFFIKVLGTAFDVSAYPGEDAVVTLERGKVNIGTATKHEASLLPGQQAIINKSEGTIEKHEVDSRSFVAWKENRLTFVDEPLEKVVACLERWYNLDIEIEEESIRNLKVNGVIEYESINEVLELLEITAPIRYTYDKTNHIFKLRAK